VVICSRKSSLALSSFHTRLVAKRLVASLLFVAPFWARCVNAMKLESCSVLLIELSLRVPGFFALSFL